MTYLLQNFQKVCDIIVFVQIRLGDLASGLTRVVRHEQSLRQFRSFLQALVAAVGGLHHLFEVASSLECLQGCSTTRRLLHGSRAGGNFLTRVLVHVDLLLAKIGIQG